MYTKIILDACNNHLGDEDIIVTMIHEAKRLKADYIKFQLYNPELLSKIYPNYDEYKKQLEKCQITESKLKLILEECIRTKIKPMFTIFSPSMVDFLKAVEPNDYAVKIASCDMCNFTLINEVLENFKTEVFISTGMHQKRDIGVVREAYTQSNIIWMYCISMYPTPYTLINFNDMCSFDGFSDHTQTTKAAQEALYHGIDYIEMHFTLGKSLPTKDSIVSKVPSEIEDVIRIRDYLYSIDKYKYRFIERTEL